MGPSASVVHGAFPSYTWRSLTRPEGFAWINVDALSEDGRGIGYGRDNSEFDHPIVWDQTGGATLLKTLGSVQGGNAGGVDGSGRISGSLSLGPDGTYVPVVWQDGQYTELPRPSSFGRAFGANGNVIVGHVLNAMGRNVASVWVNDQITTLDALPGTYSFAYRVNGHGTYVGITRAVDDDGLLTFGGFVGNGASYHVVDLSGIDQPHTLDINDSGTIAGWWTDGFGLRHSFTVADNGDATPRELGLLPGDVEGYAQGLNNDGTVVGINLDLAFNETAVAYFNGSLTPIDMNTLIDPIPGVHLVRGIDANNAGQILVEGTAPDGYRYYILTPVPEPALLGLLLPIALGSRRRRTNS